MVNNVLASTLLLSLLVLSVNCAIFSRNIQTYKTHRNYEDISGDGKYFVEWEINFDTKTILFNVIVRTTGFVGFGISQSGVMPGADIIIGGIFPNGTTYFTDRYGISNTEPIKDYSQDWHLLAASENSTHTILKFSRLLNTGDQWQDVEIKPEKRIVLMWSFGNTDRISYHFANRGSSFVNLFNLSQ